MIDMRCNYGLWKKVFVQLLTVSLFGAKTFFHTLYSYVGTSTVSIYQSSGVLQVSWLLA
jgi:hypothetical protein